MRRSGTCPITLGLIATLLLIGASATPASSSEPADTLMFLRELDDDGGRHDLVRTQEIVDINSRIEVRLDKTAIGARLADRLDLPGFSDDDLADMVKLQTLSQRGFDALPNVLAAIRSWQSAPYDVNAFEEKMDAAAQVIIELQFAFPEGHPFTEGLNPRMESAIGPDGNIPVEDQYRLVFEEARDYAAVLNARLHDALAQQAVTVMLGAWLRTEDHNVPLHLDGFDDYPAGEYYRVDRWAFAPTEAQRAEIEKLQSVATALNHQEASLGQAMVGDAAESAIAVLEDLLLECVGDLRSEIRSFTDGVTTLTEPVKNDLKRLSDDMRRLEASVLGLIRDIRNGELGHTFHAMLDRLQSDFALMEDLLKAVQSDFARLTGESGSLVTFANTGTGAVRIHARSVSEVFTTCGATFENLVLQAAHKLQLGFALLETGSAINTMALEFGDEVIRHSLQSLPEETTLDLHLTGKRSPRDVICFRLATAQVDPASEVQDATPVPLQEMTLVMHRVQVHLETVAALIFADPDKPTGLMKRFNYAPSYSVLLRWGYRSSPTYTNWINLGFGLNVAALDFDGNDNPEFGGAAVVSGISDILQAGYGYNPSAESWYWFFGVRLPFPSFWSGGNEAAPSGG